MRWRVRRTTAAALLALAATGAPTKAATARGLEVCVVGNGPLSSKDREFINSTKCDEVWRFNDMKNFRKGERVDGHIVRSNGRGGSGYHGLNKRTEKKLSSLDWSAVKRMYMGGPKGDIDAHGHKIDAHGYIFPSCHKKKSRAASAFTSGATALSYFEGRDDVDSINVLGMNFLPGRAKHERGEKKIIEKCCTKCHVRKPPKNTYAP